jgi:ABC-type dipeptide/oligopeptide/nickel transport system permease component
MVGYIGKRLVGMFFVLLIVSVLVFFLMNQVPGGPFSLGDHGYSPEEYANVLRKYGLDVPLPQRYVNYLTDALRLDFGRSFSVAGNPPVLEVLRRTWPVTLQVGLYTLLLSFGIGLIVGVVAAYHRNSWIDNIVTFLSTLGITVPSFIIATWLLLIFGYQIGWGAEHKWIIPPVTADGNAILSWDYFLPVITYALGPLAVVARYTRASVSDVLNADYVRTARSKGLTERFIMFKHVMRNALIPMITVLLPQVPNLLTGSLFIEVTFGIPGLGKFFVTSIFAHDYPMIMACVLLIAFLWSTTYLITDLLYGVIDPRIRIGGVRTS